MPQFHERIAEAFDGAPELNGMAVLLSNVEAALHQQFPLCHVDTDAIADRLVDLAEEIAALRRRTAAAVPSLPKITPEPVPAETSSTVEAVKVDAPVEPPAE